MAAPHGGRLFAFGVDLVVILLVALAVGGGWLRILGVFIAYHTVLVWLTGQTIGKALANLEVKRTDGYVYERTARGLPWVLGRASVGYLLVDMLGLGVLIALPRRNSARRCLHDLVFGSRVVLRGEQDWALPKMRERLSDFAHRREHASRQLEEDHAEPRRLSNLWHWLVTGALGLEKFLDFVQRTVTQVSSWFGGSGQAHAGTATLSTTVAAGVAVGSGVITVGSIATIAILVGPAADTRITGQFRDCNTIDHARMEQVIGLDLTPDAIRGRGCHLIHDEIARNRRVDVLLLSSPEVPATWEEFENHLRGSQGFDCTTTAIGLRSCIKDEDGSTSWYVWGGPHNGYAATITDDTKPPTDTFEERFGILEEILALLIVPDPKGSSDADPGNPGPGFPDLEEPVRQLHAGSATASKCSGA